MQTPKKVKVRMSKAATTKWADNIKNPKNSEYVSEVAFNKGTDSKKVTQEDFNKRYKPKN